MKDSEDYGALRGYSRPTGRQPTGRQPRDSPQALLGKLTHPYQIDRLEDSDKFLEVPVALLGQWAHLSGR